MPIPSVEAGPPKTPQSQESIDDEFWNIAYGMAQPPDQEEQLTLDEALRAADRESKIPYGIWNKKYPPDPDQIPYAPHTLVGGNNGNRSEFSLGPYLITYAGSDVSAAARQRAEKIINDRLEITGDGVLHGFLRRVFVGNLLRPIYSARYSGQMRREIQKDRDNGDRESIYAPVFELRRGVTPEQAREHSSKMLQASLRRAAEGDSYMRAGEKKLEIAKTEEQQSALKEAIKNLVIDYVMDPEGMSDQEFMLKRDEVFSKLEGLNPKLFSDRTYSYDNLLALAKKAEQYAREFDGTVHGRRMENVQRALDELQIAGFQTRSGSNAFSGDRRRDKLTNWVYEHRYGKATAIAAGAVLATTATVVVAQQIGRRGVSVGLGLATGVGWVGMAVGSAAWAGISERSASRRETTYHEQERYFGFQHEKTGDGSNPRRTALYELDERYKRYHFADLTAEIREYITLGRNGSAEFIASMGNDDDLSDTINILGTYLAYIAYDKDSLGSKDIFIEDAPGDRMEFYKHLFALQAKLKQYVDRHHLARFKGVALKDHYDLELQSLEEHTREKLQQNQSEWETAVGRLRRGRMTRNALIAGLASLGIGSVAGAVVGAVDRVAGVNDALASSRLVGRDDTSATGASQRIENWVNSYLDKTFMSGQKGEEVQQYQNVAMHDKIADSIATSFGQEDTPSVPPDLAKALQDGMSDLHIVAYGDLQLSLPKGFDAQFNEPVNGTGTFSIVHVSDNKVLFDNLQYDGSNYMITKESIKFLNSQGLGIDQDVVTTQAGTEAVSAKKFIASGRADGTIKDAINVDYATNQNPYLADHAETKVYWGGKNGSPYTSNGDVRLKLGDIGKHDSWSGERHYDVPKALENGNVFLTIIVNNNVHENGIYQTFQFPITADKNGVYSATIPKDNWAHSLFNKHGYDGTHVPGRNTMMVTLDRGTTAEGVRKDVPIASLSSQARDINYWIAKDAQDYTKVTLKITDEDTLFGTGTEETPPVPDTVVPGEIPRIESKPGQSVVQDIKDGLSSLGRNLFKIATYGQMPFLLAQPIGVPAVLPRRGIGAMEIGVNNVPPLTVFPATVAFAAGAAAASKIAAVDDPAVVPATVPAPGEPPTATASAPAPEPPKIPTHAVMLDGDPKKLQINDTIVADYEYSSPLRDDARLEGSNIAEVMWYAVMQNNLKQWYVVLPDDQVYGPISDEDKDDEENVKIGYSSIGGGYFRSGVWSTSQRYGVRVRGKIIRGIPVL